MDIQIVIIVAPYLYSDADRIHLLQTCREFWELTPRIELTHVYKYEDVENVVHKFNLRNVRFTFDIMANKLEKLQRMSGFQLGKIPGGVTLLEYYSNIPIESVICEGVRYVYFLYTPAKIQWLPKSVKKITVSGYKEGMYENLRGVIIEAPFGTSPYYYPYTSIPSIRAVASHSIVIGTSNNI